MTAPTLDRIVAEHKVIASMMNAMEAETNALEASGSFDLDLVRLILRYMSEYPDRFHHPKEELLFDAAAAKDGGFATVVANVRGEHQRLPGLTEALLTTLETLEIGASMPRDKVLASLRAYVEQERHHMAQERDDIFPALEMLLSAEDWTTAEAKANALEDPLAGGSDPGPYQRLQALILPEA